MKGSTLNYVC